MYFCFLRIVGYLLRQNYKLSIALKAGFAEGVNCGAEIRFFVDDRFRHYPLITKRLVELLKGA
jgi:hypothetical protein